MDLDAFAAKAALGTPGRVAPWLRPWLQRGLGPMVRLWYRPRLDDWSRLPDGPFLLVGNHSGGGSAEIACLVYLWLTSAPERRLTGLAYPSAFFLPGLAWLLRALGAVPASYLAAASALRDGMGVLVFPGGAHEAMRPVWQADRVDFGGHKGYLRIARDAWVPIVPLGIRGAHYTSIILWRSRLLAWLLVMPRLFQVRVWALSLQGLLVAIALGMALPLVWAAPLVWVWLWQPLSFAGVFPSRISMVIGDAIPPEALFGERGRDGPLDDAAERVERVIQGLVDGARVG